MDVADDDGAGRGEYIAAPVRHGRSTAEILAPDAISTRAGPEHRRAALDQVGVRSRRELVAGLAN